MAIDKDLASVELIQSRIMVIRGEKVIIDRDLAQLYGVSTKALNQAVTRNRKRFPPDFMCRVVAEEKDELVTNCDRFRPLKRRKPIPTPRCIYGKAPETDGKSNPESEPPFSD